MCLLFRIKCTILDSSRRVSMNVSPTASHSRPILRPSLGSFIDEDSLESKPNRDSLNSVSSQNITPRLHRSLLNDTKRNHSGPLYLKTKKSFTVKWCVLTNVDFSYFNEEYSLAIPKEQLSLYSILSLSRHVRTESDENGEPIFYCFDIAFITEALQVRGNYSSSAKYVVRTFGATTTQDRDTWIDRITQSLSPKLATFTMINYTLNSR